MITKGRKWRKLGGSRQNMGDKIVIFIICARTHVQLRLALLEAMQGKKIIGNGTYDVSGIGISITSLKLTKSKRIRRTQHKSLFGSSTPDEMFAFA
jgi:hypothetical protein